MKDDVSKKKSKKPIEPKSKTDETDAERRERKAKEFGAKFSDAFKAALNTDAREQGYDDGEDEG